MVVIDPGSIEFKRLGLSVDEDADGSIKGDGLLQLIDVSFSNVHIEVEYSTSCGVLEMTKPLLSISERHRIVCSRRKQSTFRDATTCFPAKWRLRNERRSSILMTQTIYGERGQTQENALTIALTFLFARCSHVISPQMENLLAAYHQYAIFALVVQTSFRDETNSSVAKCKLFSQAKV